MADGRNTVRVSRTRRLRGALLGLVAGASACTMAPRYERPDAPVAAQYRTDGDKQAAPEVLGYSEFFGDPRLRQLIEIALRENRDLRVASLDVERLRAQYRIQRAALLPGIDAVGGRNQQRVVSPLFPDQQGISFTQHTVSVGVTAYELDFFGRVQSLKDHALESYLASVEAQRSAELSLVAAVATQYFVEQALREQLARAEAIIEAAVAARDLTQRSYDVGSKSALDLRSAEALVLGLQAEVAALAQQIELAHNALVLLVGGPIPQNLPDPLPFDTESLVSDLAPGLPSHLLHRRPDILSAEHTLKAANANIGAARAAFFPRIALTAAGGSASQDVLGLFAPGSGTWQFMPQVSLPIFHGGSRMAALEVSEVQKLVAVARYEKAIQTAFREVADALASQEHLAVQLSAREAAAAAEAQRYALALRRYDVGLDDYLSVLTGQQDLFSAEQALVRVRLEQRTQMIGLYRALGGGFR